jgi:hypothetical protein
MVKFASTTTIGNSSVTDDGTSLRSTIPLYVTGAIRATGDVFAFSTSDERLKENVFTISGSLDKVMSIGGYEFDWKTIPGIQEDNVGHDVGVIAQEIQKVLPELVTTRDNGYLAVKYEKIVALLIEAIKEQQKQIDEIKSKLK